MKCSCVILNYKDARRSKRLASLLASYECVRRVVVVDNDSPDDSRKVLAEISHPKVIVEETGRNGGYGFGNNYGVRTCLEGKDTVSRELVLIANPDTMVAESTVEALIDCMERHQDSFACAPVQYDVKGKRVLGTAWPIPTPVQYAAADSVILSWLLRMPRYDSAFLDGEGDARVDCLAGALLMVDARRFEQIGGYDEDIFLFCEETSIGVRASRHGWLTYLCRNQRYDHEHSTSIGKELRSYIKHYRILSESRWCVLRHDYQVTGMMGALCELVLACANLEAMVKAPMWTFVRFFQR